jgi:hypothetical protein
MFLLYTNEDLRAESSTEEREKATQAHWAIMDETRRLGIFQGAEPLAPSSTATTVRHRDGKALITDGPFAETKEQLAGYYILDCKDLDEAISWAAKIPIVCRGTGGCVEVRPLPGLPARDGVPALDLNIPIELDEAF